MRILIVGPGRAGGAIGLAASNAGHEVIGLVARSPLRWDLPFPVITGRCPPAELVIVATRDEDIEEAARGLVQRHQPGAAVHLSGATSVSALAPLSLEGWKVGSFHPLQTLPDPHTGANSLAGSWAAITAEGELATVLFEFARGLGMEPWPLNDQDKPSYHAGAAAAAGMLVPTLAFAEKMLAQASVPLAAIGPLAQAVVQNVIDLGAEKALTGPLPRQDWETLRLHLRAATAAGEARQFLTILEAAAASARIDLPADLRLD